MLDYAMSINPFIRNLTSSGLSIYDKIEIGDPDLWIPADSLEQILNNGLKGLHLKNLPNRTRSKVVKTKVCEILGYPVPQSFKKTKPRFPGQNFDTYNQKANNLQVWNEELDPTRRYVIIKISENSIIEKVKVVTGESLSKLDTTGTLTQKYQARLIPTDKKMELISDSDTKNILPLIGIKKNLSSPSQNPQEKQILPIKNIFNSLKRLIGVCFKNPGHDQERNRGKELHKLVCQALGYKNSKEDGQFPDVKNQLLEVKLQMSATIDLGLVCPNSTIPLDLTKIKNIKIRHCDVRYALFYGKTDGTTVTLTHLFLTTGESFFSRFPQFQGKVLNKKLQIPLPKDFFSS